MAVYTVKVRARPRPTRSQLRKRLHGNALAAAKSARKHLDQALQHDQRLKARLPDVAATRLIFLGDAAAEAKVAAIIDTLDEALTSQVKTVTTR